MFTFKISPDGGTPYEVVATSRDIARWEKLTKGATMKRLETEYRIIDLYAVAYHAAVRHEQYQGTLAEFQDSADLELLDGDDDESDPTRPAVQSDGMSS